MNKYQLMNNTISVFGFDKIKESVLKKRFEYAEFGIPIPIILENDKVTVWLDRDYIAYSVPTEKVVHYRYITMDHIEEEIDQIDNPIISEEFRSAIEYFKNTGKSYLVNKMDKNWIVNDSK